MDETAKKYLLKSLHKTNGVLFEINEITDTLIFFVIAKKSAKVTRYLNFSAHYDTAYKVKTKFKIKDRIKVKFRAESTKYGNKWYTKLTAFEVLEWKKNEKKIQREEQLQKMKEENEYRNPTIDWPQE